MWELEERAYLKTGKVLILYKFYSVRYFNTDSLVIFGRIRKQTFSFYRTCHYLVVILRSSGLRCQLSVITLCPPDIRLNNTMMRYEGRNVQLSTPTIGVQSFKIFTVKIYLKFTLNHNVIKLERNIT